MRAILEPEGWPCSLDYCPPGPFIWFSKPNDILTMNGHIGYKSEYRTASNKIEAFNAGGEYLCIDETVPVQPVNLKWVDDE